MAATEYSPDQAQTEAITAHVLWMTVGLFVIEPRREEFAGSIEDGEMIDELRTDAAYAG